MLSLPFHAWSAAQDALATGRTADAARLLARVVAVGELPAGELAEAHRQLAGLQLRNGRHAKARRHLRAAAALDPKHAATFFHLGVACETDPYGSDRLAAKCYRRATKLDPLNALYRAHLARAAVRVNRDGVAMKAIDEAVKLALTDAAVLTVIVEALRECGRLNTATRIVTKARFLAPNDAKVLAVWNRVRFEAVRAAQHADRKPRMTTSPHVLPFVRVVAADGQKHVVRRDAGSAAAPHVMRFRRD
jgi:Flp pilus assembly protein TadD